MIIIAGRFTNGIKAVNEEIGIPGMENEVAIFGFVTEIIAFGTRDMKNEHGGISLGITSLVNANQRNKCENGDGIKPEDFP